MSRLRLLPLHHSAPLYTVLWIVWFVTLWFLSSGPLPGAPPIPKIPIDKVLHWGYYGIGGALSTFAVLAWVKERRMPARFFELLFLIGFGVGWLDEWHQSWYEFRSGNDLGDFLADCVGTYCGIKSAQFLWAQLLGKNL